MKNEYAEIYFRRTNKIVVSGSGEFNFAEVASLDANLRRLGYALDGELAKQLLGAPVAEIKAKHDFLVSAIKEVKGVRRYQPMYPNFPKQVMDASEAELYVNAIMHYFGTAVGLRIMPAYEKIARVELDFDESKVTFVRLGSNAGLRDLVTNLLSSKSAFSETDKEDVRSFASGDLSRYASFVKEFPNRENKAFIAAVLVANNEALPNGIKFDTATDVLRLAVAMSDGDVSLADNTKFRNFKRSERRLLLGLLDAIARPVEDMLRYQSQWKRLGEKLHPGEFSERYQNAGLAFDAIRTNKNVFESFNAKVERLIAEQDPLGAARVLVNRPGEFARRLDKVLRMSPSNLQSFVIHKFETVANDVSLTVLIQTRNAFVNRQKELRAYFPKGSVAKLHVDKSRRAAIDSMSVVRVIEILTNAIQAKVKDSGSLGKCWIDPALAGVAIPFGLRNASKGNVLGRGSRLPIAEDANFVRFFIWWKDAEAGGWGYGSHTDIDLSAVLFDDQFKVNGSITFYNLREQGAVHSGDITSAPNGASEFIDIDINRLRERGVRYVSMTLHSYSGQNFVDLPECFAGFMERRDMASGEVYDPRTVTAKFDVTSKSRFATPFIFDLEKREAIWVDMTSQAERQCSTVESTKGQIVSMVEAMTSLTPPTLFDLFYDHVAARGTRTSEKDANTVFCLKRPAEPKDGVTYVSAADVETILSEYL